MKLNIKSQVYRFSYLYILILFISSCEAGNFDKDRRQIMAKDLIRSVVPRTRSFDITGFRGRYA